MLKQILVRGAAFSSAVLLAACSNMTEYERQVESWEPIYCYKSIGAVQCYKEPKHSDSRRLVNFYGPAPENYDKPDEPEVSETQPPPMINTWVKDPEPLPKAYVKDTGSNSLQPVLARASQSSPAEERDVSFMDGLMRSLFGKPILANKPVSTPGSAAGPTATQALGGAEIDTL